MSTIPRSEIPPTLDFFEAERPTAGQRWMTIALGPLVLEFAGLDDALAETLIQRYAPYSVDGPSPGSHSVKIRLGLEDRDYFIDPPEKIEVGKVLLTYDEPTRRIRYMSYRVAGWFDTHGGGGEALLARGDFEPPERAIENYVRSCVAWQAATRGGALVHAASAVLDGKGYLFYGESGAGKSTLSECNRRARVISDDLSLLVPDDDGRLLLVGSPFRGTYTDGDRRLEADAIKLRFVGRNARRFVPDTPPFEAIDYVPHAQLELYRRDSHALLLLLDWSAAGLGLYGGKLFEYLASNRPILAIATPGGVADRLLRETRTGQAVAGDPASIAAGIETLVAQWPQRRASWDPNWDVIRRHTRERVTARLAAELDGLVS